MALLTQTSVRIPVSEPVFFGREREYVNDCLNIMQLSSGKYVEKFEEKFAEFCGVEHAVACCNGTAALHLALLSLGIGPGDVVVIPALTFAATAEAVRYTGATLAIADVEEDTWNLDAEQVHVAVRRVLPQVNPRRFYLLPVHLYGVPCDMDVLQEVAQKYNAKIIEDAAEAHGAEYRGKVVGSFGETAAFSFYGNKIITCGEGGMMVTDNPTVALAARLYRNHYMDPDPKHRYEHLAVGYNYRMTNLQAALGLGQLETFEEHAQMRRLVFERYAPLTQKFTTQNWTFGTSAKWMFAVLVPPHVSARAVMCCLLSKGIETRPVFPPIHRQQAYSSILQWSLPRAEDIARRGICLPTHARLTTEALDYIVYEFERAVEICA